MARVREMQGVSAQITALHTTDGVRRHTSHCIYAEGKGKARMCTCPECEIYMRRCTSAARCTYYEERDERIK